MGSLSDISVRDRLMFILLVAVLLAGCVGGGETEPVNDTETVSVTQTEGLSMDFYPYDRVFAEGNPVILELNLENTGEGRAENIETALFGAGFVAGQPPAYAGDTRLRGVNLDENRAGADTVVGWEIDNPVSLSQGVRETYTAGVRVSYDYQTTADASLTLVSEQNFDGDDAPVTTSTTAGPLGVEFDITSPEPVYSEEEEETTEISVPVRIQNLGSGEVADLDRQSRPVHVMYAEFPETDAATLDCPPTVRLFDDYATLRCTATVPTDVFERDLRMELHMEYSYFQREQTAFDIEGR